MIRPNDETHGSRDTVPVTNSTQLLKAPEAARLLAIGTRKLWELTNRGEIPHVRIGRAVRQPKFKARSADRRNGVTGRLRKNRRGLFDSI